MKESPPFIAALSESTSYGTPSDWWDPSYLPAFSCKSIFGFTFCSKAERMQKITKYVVSQRHGAVIKFKTLHGTLNLGNSRRSGVQGQTELRRHGAGLLGTVMIPMNPMAPRGCPICRTLGAYVSLTGLSWGLISCHVVSQLSFPEACSSWMKRGEDSVHFYIRWTHHEC